MSTSPKQSRRQEMHVNSLAAFWEGEEMLFGKRELAVLAALRAHGPMTDREVMLRLDFSDPNAVRPRITGLMEDGVLVECGEKSDPITRKTVRIVRIADNPLAPQRQFEFAVEPREPKIAVAS